ncbi:MAG: hypothetical protein IJ187_02435 [Neisseriaceae bacterium]|nr:hypothetical protein [Neisseriaceae bacterium]MBQ9724228.1 hypothetical protein [Neisseriaceae bacterium]
MPNNSPNANGLGCGYEKTAVVAVFFVVIIVSGSLKEIPAKLASVAHFCVVRCSKS